MERLRKWEALAAKRNKERDYVTFAIGNDAVDEVFDMLPEILDVVDAAENVLEVPFHFDATIPGYVNPVKDLRDKLAALKRRSQRDEHD